MQIWQSIVLGIVEGLTEFLPVSSTGHLIIANSLLGLSGDATAAFDVCIQGGAILAVVLLFRDRFRELLSITPGRISQFQSAVLTAIIPFLIAGAIFGGSIKRNLFSTNSVAVALIVGGVLLIWAARKYTKNPATEEHTLANVASLTRKQAVIIGLCQLGALWPGMSRSACTIIGGLVAGLPLKTAAEFSFIIAVPILLAASAKDGLHAITTFSSSELITLAIGFIVSFIFALLSLKVFLQLLTRVGLGAFGWYRVVLGFAILLFRN